MGYKHYRFARRVDADTLMFKSPSVEDIMSFHRAHATILVMRGGYPTGGGLQFFANQADSLPNWQMTATAFTLKPVADVNLKLETSGTGVTQFGVHAGTGDTVSDGNIPIKDLLGNTRKLMTTP